MLTIGSTYTHTHTHTHTYIYIYIYIYIFIFQPIFHMQATIQSQSFCHTKAKSALLFIHIWMENRWIYIFHKYISVMWNANSLVQAFWSRVTDSISNDNNCHATSAYIYNIYIHIYICVCVCACVVCVWGLEWNTLPSLNYINLSFHTPFLFSHIYIYIYIYIYI